VVTVVTVVTVATVATVAAVTTAASVAKVATVVTLTVVTVVTVATQRHDCHLGSDATPKSSDQILGKSYGIRGSRFPEAMTGRGCRRVPQRPESAITPAAAGRSSSSLRAQPTALPFLHRPTELQ
jgi:hypothetical protein